MESNTTKKEFNRFKKLKIKLELIKADIDFLGKCKRHKVFPNFIQNNVRYKKKDKNLEKVMNSAKNKLLDIEIHKQFARAEKAGREAYSLHLYLLKNTHDIVWKEMYDNIVQIGNYKLMRKRQIQKRKLHKLKLDQCVSEHKDVNNKRNFVINKSKKKFTEKQLELLNRGLKYCPEPEEAPISEIVVAIESAIKFFPIEEKMNAREIASKVLDVDANKEKNNSKEWKIIKELKKSDCVFLNPDKGKAVVILDREDYREAAMEHLGSENYERVITKRQFPVDKLQEEVKSELKRLKDDGLLNGQEVRNLIVSNPVIPQFSCLPKIHKEGNKFRPVVSNVNTPTSKICKLLVQKLRKLQRPFSLSIRNSFEAAEELAKVKVSDDENLISFDVEALYPSVPVEESISMFTEWINEQDISDVDSHLIVGLLKLVMRQRWIQFEGQIYSQKEGLFIGNALSPILAEIFMGRLERNAMRQAWFPRIWRRYVDDVVAIVKKGEEELVLKELNQRHSAIKFTSEVETKGCLSFLDLQLIREGESIGFDIFRKPTDAPLCIPNSSHHPWRHKIAAFESAIFRMWNLPLSKERRRKELEYIIGMAQINGYKKSMVMKLSRKHRLRIERKRHTLLNPGYENLAGKKAKTNVKDKKRKSFLTIPYHAKLTNRLSNRLKAGGISVIYQSRGNLSSLIGRGKQKRQIGERSGIYNIKCNDCEGNYIGQTKRRVETREKEHSRALKLNQPSKSAMAAHCLDEGHIKGECRVLKEVRNPYQLDAWESLYIAKGKDLVNTGEPPIRSKLFEYASVKSF
jgi:hypothetical protein